VMAQEMLGAHAPIGTGALRPVVRLAAIGLLPPAVRDDYAFAWDARHEAALMCSAALLRRVRPILPDLRLVLGYAARGGGEQAKQATAYDSMTTPAASGGQKVSRKKRAIN
jgi:hypothetical protein